MIYNEKECESFREVAIKRLQQGYPIEQIFDGKPHGFTQYLKDHPELRIKLPKTNSIPVVECWNCKKSFSGNKCPFCGAFKPKL